MMHRAAWLVLMVARVCGAISAAAGAAPCTTTDACLQQIEAAQRATTSIQARFTQTKHMSLLAEPLVATGRFSFKRPDRIRWDIEAPDPTTVIINGDRLLIPGLPEEDRDALAAMPVATALGQVSALIRGDVSGLRAGFNATAKQRDGAVQVELVPLQDGMGGMFSRIDLTFAAPDLRLRAIRLENRLGDRVEVAFDEVAINAPVPDSLFALPTKAPTP